jgi:hypothetical protein
MIPPQDVHASRGPAHTTGSRSWEDQSAAWRALAVVSVGLACSIATGLLHTAELFVTRHLLKELVWFSRDFVWMAPITYTAVFLPGIVVLAACAALVRARVVFQFSVVCFVTVGVFGLLLPYPQIARVASLVLGIGAGVQVARTLTPAAVSGMRWWRRALTAEVLCALAIALLAPRFRQFGEGRALSQLPARAEDAPNVLLTILDTVRAASMGLYGGGFDNTPHLERWARDGVVFDRAFSAAPWTLPSHASMFTGRYVDRLSTDWKRPFDGSDSTLAEMFRRRGYATAGFVANVQFTSYDTGLDRGFIHYEDYRVDRRQAMWRSSCTQTALFQQLRHPASLHAAIQAVLHPDLTIDPKHHFSAKDGSEVTASFLRWQRSTQRAPFFAFLNFMDGNLPFFVPPSFDRFDTGDARHDRYAGAIAFLDSQVDSILTTLQAEGILDRTIVVIAGDHGELFGATHGLVGHGHDLYPNVLRVPLLIRYPARVPAGGRIEQLVSLRDLAATILDLAGAANASVRGESLART